MVMSISDADALLSTGRISPATHAGIIAANGGQPSMPSFGAPTTPAAPPPMMAPPPGPAPSPLEAAIGQANAGAPLPQGAPAAPTDAPKGIDAFLPAMRDAPAPAPAPLPHGDVQVGHIAQSNAPSPGAIAAATGAAPSGPSGANMMLAAQMGGLENAKGAQAALNKTGAMQAVEAEDMRAQHQAAADQQRVLAMAAQQDEDAHRAQLVADREKAIADYQNTKVDPNQVTKQRGVLGNILAAIAMGAGAFGSAVTHAPNYAQQILDKQVDDNIRAQEGEIAKLGHAVDMKTNSVAAYRQITGDNEAARALAKADEIGRYRDDLAANMAKYGNAEQQIKGQATLDNYTTQQQELKAQARMLVEKAAGAQAAAAAAKQSQQQAAIASTAKELVLKGQDPVEAARTATALHTGRVIGSAPLQAPEMPGSGGADAKKREQELSDKQKSINEASRQLDNMHASPMLDKLGLLPGLAGDGALSQRLMPESSAIAKRVNSMNLIMASTAGKTLKDSEGRIPPQILEMVHQFDIKPGDTKDIAQEKIRGLQQFVHEQGRQGGVNAPEPNAESRAGEGLGFKAGL